MAGGRMKILSPVRKFYKMLGIYPSNTIDAKNIFFIISLIQLIISTLAFISINAKSTDEFGIAFYVFITATTQLVHLLISIKKIPNISDLIEKYEAFIEKSK